MKRKKRHEDHVNHEAWAIPYGDLVTLLLAFFVVMYAISSVNEGKYRELSQSLVAAFQGTPKTTRPIQIGDRPTSVDAAPIPTPSEDMRENLDIMAKDIRSALAELIDLDQVRVRVTPLWLEVEIKTDLLFAVGEAEVSQSALPVLEQLGDILQPMPNPLRVEGHTDDVPISTTRFPSNWELSAARASRVVRLFQETGLAPERMVAVGLGEHRPADDNDSVEGRNRNRRVSIVVLAKDDSPENLGRSLRDVEVGS